MFAATAAVSIFSLDHSGIRVIGQIPSGLPVPGVTGIPLSDLVALLVPAGGIAIVAFSDNVLTARTFAARKGQYIDANAELRALGVCNLGAGLAHGFPVSCSGSRTAVGDAVGSRTQLYSLVTLAILMIVMLTSGGVLAMFPTARTGCAGGVCRCAADRRARVQTARALSAQRTCPGAVDDAASIHRADESVPRQL